MGITYRSMDRSLTDDEINALQNTMRERAAVVHSGVLEKAGLQHRHGWAFGLGLERLAMVLFAIPDIRLFWMDDKRFTKQFKAGQLTPFKPYSKYPFIQKDMSFWLPEDFEPNDFFELGRGVAG